MKPIKPFGASKTYTLVAGTSYKETDLIPIEDAGHVSFMASIDTAGITVTPTVYYVYGSEVGASNALANTDNSDAATFTSTAKFECSLNKQDHMKAAIGVVFRFTFSTVIAGAILTAEFVTSNTEARR